MYLCAAVGRPVNSLLVGPLPADLSGGLLPLSAGTMVPENSHGRAFLHLPRAVSHHVMTISFKTMGKVLMWHSAIVCLLQI